MTDQGEHVPTPQETQIYQALTDGDHDTIQQLHDTAYQADQTPPDPTPDDWVSPASQYDVDYSYAWSHYQADHEAPEPEREANTVDEVTEQNTAAPDTQPEPEPESAAEGEPAA